MLITAIVISAGLAYAAAIGSGSGWSTSGSWQPMSGVFSGLDSGSITSNYGSNWCRAIHPVTTNSAGSFTATYQFTVNNLSSDVFVGVANGISDSNDLLVGYSKDYNAFIVTLNQQSALANLGGSVDPNTQYTATISSTDGKTFHISVSGAGSYDYTSGFAPTYATLSINNQGAAKGPSVDSVTYTSDPSSTATPTATPDTNSTSNATSTVPAYIDHSDMQNWYATEYVPPVLSNQSLVYDESGHIVKVVTGKPGQATTMPVSGVTVTPTAIPTAAPASNVTAPMNVTKNNTPTITPVATVAPTKSQSPGFGIVLVAIGMLAAIFVVSRKK